jgi:HEAT repeat protein
MDILALIIGLVIGGAIAYGFFKNQSSQTEQERVFELKKVREELERVHESRLKTAIQAARKDYETQLAQRETELKQAHQAELEARLSALQAEHQQELNAAIAPPPQTSPALTENVNAAVPSFGDFESLLEPVEDDEELETSVKSEEIPSIVRQEIVSPAPQPTLEETIAAIANPSRLKPYLRHPSHRARAALAATLGKTVRGQPMRTEVSQAIEILAILAQDRSAVVRQAAIEAIANVKSERVIPLLQRALHDCDRNVIKTASAAIARFKFYPEKRFSQLPFNAAQQRRRTP